MQEDTATPYVWFLVEDAFEYLGCHVVPCSCYLSFTLLFPYSSSKINNFDMIIVDTSLAIQKDDIIQLDIAMDDSLLMQVCKCAEQLLCDIDNKCLRELF